jgi:hypothetical protein
MPPKTGPSKKNVEKVKAKIIEVNKIRRKSLFINYQIF